MKISTIVNKLKALGIECENASGIVCNGYRCGSIEIKTPSDLDGIGDFLKHGIALPCSSRGVYMPVSAIKKWLNA